MKALVVLIALLLAAASSPAQEQASLRVEREFVLYGGESHALCWSPDGRWLASGGDMGDAVVLDAENGAVRCVLAASDHWIGKLRFSPDGERLAVSGRSLTVWRLRDGEKLADLPCQVAAFDWSRDGARLAVWPGGSEVLVLRGDDFAQVARLALPDRHGAGVVAFDATGTRLAIGGRSGTTLVLDVVGGAPLQELEESHEVSGVGWLDDGRLVRLGVEGRVHGWRSEPVPVGGRGFRFEVQGDGSRLLVRSWERTLLLPPRGEPLGLAGSGPMALHPNGHRWARVLDGQLQLWRDGELQRTLVKPHREWPGEAVLMGDGRHVIVRGARQRSHVQAVFEVASGLRVEGFGVPADGFLLPNRQGVEVAVLRGLRRGAHAEPGGPRLEYWTAGAPGRLVRSTPLPVQRVHRSPGEVALSADARFLSVGDEVHDLLTSARCPGPQDRLVRQVAACCGGDYVVQREAFAGGTPGSRGFGAVRAVDRDGEVVAAYELEDGAPSDLAVAPDGARVLVCRQGRIDLLSLPELALLASFSWGWGSARWLDERWLLGSGPNGVQVADIDSHLVAATLESSGRCVDFDVARGLAVVALRDRVQLVRVTWPQPPQEPQQQDPVPPPSPREPVDYLVVRVDLDDKRDTDRGFLAAATAAQQRHAAATFDWDGTDYDALAAELRRRQPENVLFVMRPEHLDVVRHRRILLLTSKLDDDWFVDCAFGYLTGADGDACERFWQRIEQRRERGDATHTWAELSVASMDKSLVYRGALPVMAKAAGFEGDSYYFGTSDADRERLVAQALAATDTADVLHFSGNGDPEGIWLFSDQRNLERDKHWPYDAARVGEDPDGVMPRLLAARFAGRSWRAPIVWSGTCHAGAVDRVFVEGDIVSTFGRTERVTVHHLSKAHSLALAWLEAGACALLVPIAANHGMSASMEIDFALQHGASLGEAVKSSWDDVLLQAEGQLVLDLPVEGEAQRRGGERVMQGGGANRLLLGDPALRPFVAATHPMESVHVEPRDGARGGVVTVAWTGGWHWRAWDIYGTDPARDWRVLARVDAAALGLDGVSDGATLEVQVTATGNDGTAMPYALQRCAIERHRGKVWLHLQANAPRGATERKAATVQFVVGVR